MVQHVDRRMKSGLVVRIAIAGDNELTGELPLQPTNDLSAYTIANVVGVLVNYGDSDFIPSFSREFPKISELCVELERRVAASEDFTLLYEL